MSVYVCLRRREHYLDEKERRLRVVCSLRGPNAEAVDAFVREAVQVSQCRAVLFPHTVVASHATAPKSPP